MPKPHYAPSRFQLVFAILAAAWPLFSLRALPFIFHTSTNGPLSSGTALVGGPFTLTDQNGRKVTREGFSRKIHAGIFRLHLLSGYLPNRTASHVGSARQPGRKGGRGPAGLHQCRSAARYAGSLEAVCRKFSSPPHGPHRNARGDCLGRKDLPGVLQQG